MLAGLVLADDAGDVLWLDDGAVADGELLLPGRGRAAAAGPG